MKDAWIKVKTGFQAVWQKLQPVYHVIREIVIGIFNAIRFVVEYVIRMHKLLMAIPVVLATVYLANYNYELLPEQVGIMLQESGQYAQVVSRDVAILGPVAVTAFCLVLMFCSRRPVYPWVISIFSLVLPILILLTNVFPA